MYHLKCISKLHSRSMRNSCQQILTKRYYFLFELTKNDNSDDKASKYANRITADNEFEMGTDKNYPNSQTLECEKTKFKQIH